MEYSARYVHKISPSEKDVTGPFSLSSSALSDRTSLGAQLRKARVLGKGDRIASFRVEPGFRIVVFPQASIWHSIILELTGTGVHQLARESFLSTRKLAETPDAFTHKGMAARVAILKRGRDYLADLARAKHATDSGGWNQSKAWADDLTRELSKDEARRDYFEKHERGENPRTGESVNLPAWPGALHVYSYLYRHLESLGRQHGKSGLLGKRKSVPDEMREIVSALNRGNEEELKAIQLRIKTEDVLKSRRHERGDNPRVSRSARDMTLKARVKVLVGRGKK